MAAFDGSWQLLLVLTATTTLLSIVCNGAATKQTSSTAAGQSREIHTNGAYKNIGHVYANHMGQQQQQQQQQQRQQQPLQQYYYNLHYKQNSSSGSNHNGTPTHTSQKLLTPTEAEVAKAEEAARRIYSEISINSGNADGGGWRNIHNNDNGGNGRSYNFEVAKLNDLTNLSGLRHISSGFGSSWNTAGHGGRSISSGDSSEAKKTTIAKHHIPIYEEQQENDYNSATLGTSGTAGHIAGENNQHGNSGNGWMGRSISSSNYNSGSSIGNDALSTALYNLHTAGTHNDFPSAYGGKFSSTLGSDAHTTTSSQSNDKISDGNFLHRYEHNSGGYDELSASATYQNQQPSSPSAPMQYYSSHDSYAHQHFGPDSGGISSGSSTDIDVSLDGSHSGAEGGGIEYDDDGSSVHSYDDANNYLAEQHSPNNGNSAPDVINYIPYPVVKKVHVPVREPVQIPVSHAVLIPVSKPVPIHIPITKHVPVPVEKELRVPVERVVPYPVEKPVAVPVEKRIPFEVVKYIAVKVPHPFPVKVPVFKTILHKIHKVQKGGWW